MPALLERTSAEKRRCNAVQPGKFTSVISGPAARENVLMPGMRTFSTRCFAEAFAIGDLEEAAGVCVYRHSSLDIVKPVIHTGWYVDGAHELQTQSIEVA